MSLTDSFKGVHVLLGTVRLSGDFVTSSERVWTLVSAAGGKCLESAAVSSVVLKYVELCFRNVFRTFQQIANRPISVLELLCYSL